MNKSNLFRGLTCVILFVLGLVIGFSIVAFSHATVINDFFDVSTSKLVLKEGVTSEEDVEKPQYFKSEFAKDINNVTGDELAAKNAAVAAFVETEAEEGGVLLKNDNNALPLAKGSKVSLFGRATVNPYYKGNSGGGSGGTKVTYLEALQDPERAGFQVNETLVEAYEADTSPTRSATTRTIGESPVSVYTDDVQETFADYSDAAIVMLAREGAESNDLHREDSEGISQLALHKDEADMLSIVKRYKDNGTFKKVIVLLNSGHPMEVKWLEEYGVDACLVIGGPGNSTGFRGVSDLLVGNANPSGRLVETYASNSLSAPATVNFGEFSYTNANEVVAGVTDNATDSRYYVAEAEGIYIGYKYYETRYEDCVLDQGNADGSAGVWDSEGLSWNYADEVSFPFGYGLSYTTFAQTMDPVVEINEEEDTMTVRGTVTNTGRVAGKSVVELYAQTPYGDYEKENDVEKSAVQLVGFTKTDVIQPQDSVDYEITFDRYFLASYDYTNAKGYILSEGDYYLAVGDNAHDALNNILAKKGASGMTDHTGAAATGDVNKVYTWSQDALDTETYMYSDANYRVTNRLDEANLNHWKDGTIKYLSRKDWQGTYPVEPTKVEATDELIARLSTDTYKKPDDAPSATAVTLGAKNNIKLADMWGVAFDDPLWEDFIDQMTLTELVEMTMESSGIQEAISINAPDTSNSDGPDGIRGNAYVNESLAAASWSKEQLALRGYYMGEDAVMAHASQQVWCPGLNMHRTPFGGRNFEYYSEDSILAYELSAAQVAEMERMGVSAGPKHFFANDQETWRTGVATYANEQALREIPLRAFEGAFVKGGATSTMTCFNRIGPTWIGHHSGVQTEILRNEWGFVGFTITDASGANSYMHTVEAIMHDTDLFNAMTGDARTDRIRDINRAISENDDGNIILQLKEIAHRVYYTYAHTNLMNGLSTAYDVVPVTPWWQILIICVDIGLGVITLGMAALFCVFTYVKKERT